MYSAERCNQLLMHLTRVPGLWIAILCWFAIFKSITNVENDSEDRGVIKLELFLECSFCCCLPASSICWHVAHILLLRAVEDVKPDAAVRMYIDACALLEEDGRDQMAFDSYRSAASIYIKLNR